MIRMLCAMLLWAGAVQAQTHAVMLEDVEGARIQIATLDVAPSGKYSVDMATEPFEEHFLSMRPFKCIEGPDKHWCHLPYPYEIRRSLADDPVDLEYDFLFIWKGANEYGIDTWNGVYYRLEPTDDGYDGAMYELDMGVLAVPPDPGVLRPLEDDDLHEADPTSHWLPRMVVRPLPQG